VVLSELSLGVGPSKNDVLLMMKISSKLLGSFIGISLLTGIVGAVAIIQSQKIAETLAIALTHH